MHGRHLHQTLENNGRAVGTWVQMNSPETCEIAALSGFDFVIVDMEHGSFGIAEATAMVKSVQVGGADAVVRVPDGSRTTLKRVLDIGVAAVLVPALENADDAADAVAATQFEPHGRRGACPCVRSVDYGVTSWRDRVGDADNPGVWVLIENPSAVKDIDRIVRTGIEAVVLGPFDLSMTMGHNGDFHHPEVVEALEFVCRAATNAGVEVVYVGLDQDPEGNVRNSAPWRDLGARLTTTLLDRSVLVHAYTTTLASMRNR